MGINRRDPRLAGGREELQRLQTAAQNQAGAADFNANRPRLAWDMAAGNPQMQQQWIAWANNPALHDPSRQITPEQFGTGVGPEMLRNQAYGTAPIPSAQPGPTAQPQTGGLSPFFRNMGGPTKDAPGRNQAIGRMLLGK